ncbi:hypothetical protein V7006_13125, partial [Bacillus safensis]|uniref:hypothetical protein n=1 Tax=Bacillus safensis TaxID=561879 RepID=UPI0030007E7A
TNPFCERTNSVGSFLCSFAFHLNTLCSEEDGTVYINNDNYYQKEIIIKSEPVIMSDRPIKSLK